MRTQLHHLLGAALALLVTSATTPKAEAQADNQRIVFYAPVTVATLDRKTHTVIYTTTNQIHTMEPDGTDERQLTFGTEACFFPSWRPGKTHILYHSGDTLYVMDADGRGTFAVATANGVGADWSPDGDSIAFMGRGASSSGPLGLYVVSVDPLAKGNKKVGTPVLVAQGSFYGPTWSPNGDKIAFTGNGRIGVLDLVTGLVTSLDSMVGILPGWSPDGEKIVFCGKADNTVVNNELYIMKADFSEITQVTSLNYFVDWPSLSSDGTQVAFRFGSGHSGDAAIYKLTLETGELVLLRDLADHPDWNP